MLLQYLLLLLSFVRTAFCDCGIYHSRTFKVPQGTACVFNQKLPWMEAYLEELIIDGTLQIQEDIEDIHIRFKKLVFGPSGVLFIGSESTILNSRIVFEQTQDQNCEEANLGSFVLKSMEHFILDIKPPAFKGEKQIKLAGSTVVYYLGQKVTLYDSINNVSETKTITNIEDATISFKEALEHTYTAEPRLYNQFLKPFQWMIPKYRERGIFLKNMCVSGSSGHFKGVTFINAKCFQFRKYTLLESSLFYDDEVIPESNPTSLRLFQFYGIIEGNIFSGLNNVEFDYFLPDHEKQYFSPVNTFLNVGKSKLVYHTPLYRLEIVNSRIEFVNGGTENLSLIFFNSSIYHSQISFNEDIPIREIVLYGSVLSTLPQFQFPPQLYYLTLNYTTIESMTLDLTQSRWLDGLMIRDSVFLSNGLSQHVITLPSRGSKESILTQKRITLISNTFLGYAQNVIGTPESSQLTSSGIQRRTAQVPIYENDVFYSIYVAQNVFHADIATLQRYPHYLHFRSQPLFNLENSRVRRIFLPEKSDQELQASQFIIPIEEYNLKNHHLLLQPLNYILNGYQMDYFPSYCIIQEVTFINGEQLDYDIYLINNGNDRFKLDNREIQMISPKIHEIVFTPKADPNIVLQVQKIDLLIIRGSAVPGNASFQIFFSNTISAIKEVIINTSRDKKPISVSSGANDAERKPSDTRITFKRPITQNILNVSWGRLPRGDPVSVSIVFSYCNQGELINRENSECVEICPRGTQKLELSCVKKSLERGFFEMTDEVTRDGVQMYGQCRYGCKTCEDSETCSECFPTYLLSNGACIDACNQREYFLEREEECKKCPEGCQHCTSDDKCEFSDSHRVHQSGEICPEGTMSEGKQCISCSPSCKTCTDSSELSCTSCAPGLASYRNLCVDVSYIIPIQSEILKCAAGTTRTGNICSACPPSCAECEPAHDNSGGLICLICKYNANLKVEGAVKQCQLCKVGEFAFLNSCNACSEVCEPEEGCFGPSAYQCVRCKAGFFRIQEKGACIKCDSSCQECEGSANHCTQCPPHRPVLINNRCQQDCPSGEFAKLVYGVYICQKCDTSVCAECTIREDNCTQCADYSRILHEGNCYIDCQPGYYEDPTQSCSRCDEQKCASCIEAPDKCTSCIGYQYLVDNKCYSDCPDGTYFSADRYYRECKKCPDSCLVCELEEVEVDGEIEGNIVCLQCRHPYMLVGTECKGKCPSGYFADHIEYSVQCVQCHENCRKCTEHADHCTECANGRYKLSDSCLSHCPDGYFQDEVKKQCFSCIDQNCRHCKKNAFSCSVCEGNYNLQSGQCVKSCSEGFYPVIQNNQSSECRKCDRTCKTCEGEASNCTNCHKDSYSYQNNQCVSTCPLNTYASEDRICLQCHTDCSKGCVGPKQEDCLERMKVIIEKNQDAMMVAIFVPALSLLIGLAAYFYCYCKKKKRQQKPSNVSSISSRYERQSSADVHTLVQLEKIESQKPS